MKVLISSTGADVDAIMKAILEGGHPRLGYNAQTRQVVDVQEDGILDATELVIRAIELAVDLARTFLETASWQSSKS
jgi:chaperonin GroEL (HSP60 family)